MNIISKMDYCYDEDGDVILEKDGVLANPNIHFDSNFKQTGDSILLTGTHETAKKIWLLAHLDNISYLVQPQLNGVYPLVPLCYHMMAPGKLPGAVVSYDIESRKYKIVSEGFIVTDNTGAVFYDPTDGKEVRAGQRVCFKSDFSWNKVTGEIRGSIDDIAGAIALIFAVNSWPITISN